MTPFAQVIVAHCVCGEAETPKRKPITNDEKLRAVGCSIHSRPKTGPDLWRLPEKHGGKIVSTEDALFAMVNDMLALKKAAPAKA